MNSTRPSITVRAFAEMLTMPAYGQVQILKQQKYPRAEHARFRRPYYKHALDGIRRYYAGGNADEELEHARRLIAKSKAQESRKEHNLRALHAFESSDQTARHLKPRAGLRVQRALQEVELRLSFDLVAQEKGHDRMIFYNLRAQPLDAEVARATIELAHWVLNETSPDLKAQALEIVDLAAGTTHTISRSRKMTRNRASQNAEIIATLWPTI